MKLVVSVPVIRTVTLVVNVPVTGILILVVSGLVNKCCDINYKCSSHTNILTLIVSAAVTSLFIVTEFVTSFRNRPHGCVSVRMS